MKNVMLAELWYITTILPKWRISRILAGNNNKAIYTQGVVLDQSNGKNIMGCSLMQSSVLYFAMSHSCHNKWTAKESRQ
jgi:hypothetical protein